MDIQHHLEIKASPAAIYQAVSTKAGISGWWAQDCRVGEKEGEDSLLRFNKQGTIVEMGFRTKTLIPNRKVVWECTENGNPAWIGTEIVTEITPTDEGVKVVLSHANFDEQWRGKEPYEMTRQTWGHFAKSLASFCEQGVGQPW